MKNYTIISTLLMLLVCSCNDFLDREPLSNISPDNYLNTADQLAAYTINYYSIIPTLGQNDTPYEWDAHTDCVAALTPDSRFVPGLWQVPQSGGNWSFENIYAINYFLENVLPKAEAGEISGGSNMVNHYIGEAYFLRAFEYYKKLRNIGDFPILEKTYPDQKDILTEISKRAPRNEVARFILADCDAAIENMRESSPDGARNRLSRKCAYLLKSRVALYEATWLKYFKGTAFVPGGSGWPGAEKEYNAGYTYPAGDIDGEIEFFLDEAIAAAEVIADQVALQSNNGETIQNASSPKNPFFDMFGAVDLSPYPEILLWRKYDKSLGITHNTVLMAASSNDGCGVTRGFVERFLMKNGLPIYAAGSGYGGDDWISGLRTDRDDRLRLFLKNYGDPNIVYNVGTGVPISITEPRPDILTSNTGSRYSTGYVLRKFGNYDYLHGYTGQSYTGVPIFRAAEAYLNYIEAYYERHGSLNAKAKQYWVELRDRAGVDNDIDKTIAATDMDKEALIDWGAWSGGEKVDATLYNIRRERSCELSSEGFRWADLKRWRSMDQMIATPYHIEGIKIWGPMNSWWSAGELVYGAGNTNANVSAPALSDYLRPYEIRSNSNAYEGYRWNMAHYLEPISYQEFILTAENNDAETSPIYQNPGWLLAPNQGPEN